MKTTKLLLAAALLAGTAALAFATPPLPYWAQPAKAPQADKAAAGCKFCSPTGTVSCAGCMCASMRKS